MKQGLPKLKLETDCQKCLSKSATEVEIQITPNNIQTKALLHTISLGQHKQLLQAQRTREFSSSVASLSALLQHWSVHLFPYLTALAFFTHAHQCFCFSWHLLSHGIYMFLPSEGKRIKHHLNRIPTNRVECHPAYWRIP